jgi:hypothetical protein
MTGELKSMFEQHLNEPNMNDLAEKQRVEIEEKKKKEFYRKQSKIIF